MPKFLHIADIHLGFDRYDSAERTKDFFRCLHDVFQRYALNERVDFVLIAGDLFEHRNIQPATLNQAQICLQELKLAGIPVFAIEGNHDNRPYGTRTSWLKYLAEWQLLVLLEPGDIKAGEPFYSPWNPERCCGGYIDLACGVRVIGSNWYGATAPNAIIQIAQAIQDLPAGPPHTILMFHHGLEGQIARYSGALRYGDLLPLKEVGVDYLALGHIHKHYTVDNWIFNPGSLEANNVEESLFHRGAYLVNLSTQGINAILQTDYYQRPIYRLELKIPDSLGPDELTQVALSYVGQAINQQPAQSIPPIIELKLHGRINFDRFDLDIRSLQRQLQQTSGALVFLIKLDINEAEYSTPFSDEQTREEIEHSIFLDILSAHRDYKKRAVQLSKGLISLKDIQLSGGTDTILYETVQTLLTNTPPN